MNSLTFYGLTNKDVKMFKRIFKHNNPEELEQALMRVDTEKSTTSF